MLPKSLSGGTSLKFMLRKPMAVVRMVKNTGWVLIRKLSTMASRLKLPWRISRSIGIRM